MRPHPFFPTLEFRICDIPTRVDDTIAIAALFQALVAKVNRLLDQNLTFRPHHKMLIEENKWRAVRYGLDGKMIDFGKGREVPTVTSSANYYLSSTKSWTTWDRARDRTHSHDP